MKRFSFMTALLLVVAMFVMATGQKEAAQDAESSGVVDVWTWESQENQQAIIDAFNVDFPDIEIVFTSVNASEMFQKLQASIIAGADLPDVVWMEISQRGNLMDLDIWEDLGSAPYSLGEKDLLSFLEPVSYWNGKLIGLEVSPPMSGLSYRRDLALEYLGTDDSDILASKLPNWDKVMDFGREMKKESGGTKYLFPGITDAFYIMVNQNSEPYIKGRNSNLNKSVLPTFERLVTMRKEGLVDIIRRWTPGWNESFSSGNYMFYMCPTWFPTWVLKANDPDGAGNWGMMISPEGGYLAGGTIVAIPEKAEDKEVAFEYIKWTYFSKAGAAANRDNLGYFSPYLPAYQNPAFYSEHDAYFGGQDILSTYSQKVMPSMATPRSPSTIDVAISDLFSEALVELNENSDITATEMIELIEEGLRQKDLID